MVTAQKSPAVFCPACGKRILINSGSCHTGTFNPARPAYNIAEVDVFLVGINNTLACYENKASELTGKMELLVDEIECLREINAQYERETAGTKSDLRSCAEKSGNSEVSILTKDHLLGSVKCVKQKMLFQIATAEAVVKQNVIRPDSKLSNLK